jgi:hypothetical protein
MIGKTKQMCFPEMMLRTKRKLWTRIPARGPLPPPRKID